LRYSLASSARVGEEKVVSTRFQKSSRKSHTYAIWPGLFLAEDFVQEGFDLIPYRMDFGREHAHNFLQRCQGQG